MLAGDWDLAKKYDQDLNILHDKGQGYIESHLISDTLLPEKVSSLPIPQHGLEAGCYEYAHALFPQYNLWQHLQTLSISIKAKSPSV